MTHTSASFQTSDGLKIYTEAWLPDANPKAVVLIVHGYAEHIGRYPHVAGYLVQHGYAVYGLDHRGHGKSDGLRVYFDTFDQPINDLAPFVDQVKAAHPGKKLFLYGHSMGSLIALDFALRHPDVLAGLILSGCAVNADTTVPGALLAVGGLLDKVIPKVALFPALPSSGLSHDSAVVSAYDNDPLVTRSPWRVRTALLLLQAGQRLRERAGELRLPLLVLHGGEDPIVPVSGGKLIYERAASTDKTLHIYPGLYHEIHNEPEQGTVLADMTTWLDQH